MPNPKRKHSKARSRKRRAHHFLTKPPASTCPECGEPTIPHRVCPHCGKYRGREVVEIEAE